MRHGIRMNYLSLFFLAMFFLTEAEAQTSWMKFYEDASMYNDCPIELPGGSVLTSFVFSGIAVMDPDGSFIEMNSFSTPYSDHPWMRGSAAYDVDRYAFTSVIYSGTCTMNSGSITRHFDPAIGFMDSLGRVSELHRYRLNGPDCTGHPDDVLVTSDGSILIWGKSSFYALKASASGEVIWAKRFNGTGGFDFIKELPSGDLLAGVSMEGAGATVLRMSPMGEVLWCRSYFRPTGVMRDAIIRSDDSFVVVGFTTGLPQEYPPPVGYDPRFFVMELDGEGDVQACRGFDADAVWDLQYSAHATSTIDGQEVFMVSSPSGSMLMKLELDGDTLWTRWQGAAGFRYEAMGLLAISDGGFLISGIATGNFTWSPLITRSYLFKTDASGRLPCFDRQLPVYVTDLAPIDSSFTISANDGAEMEDVEFENQNVPGFESYEGCAYSNDISSVEEVSFLMSPNPNNGRFSVQFAHPLRAGTDCTVHDTMGKLLLKRRLPTGNTLEEVDLTRFGTGTYALRFTGPGGACYKLVVVQ